MMKEIRLPALHPMFQPRLDPERRRPGHPGTAVQIGEDLFEVVSPVPKVWWERALAIMGSGLKNISLGVYEFWSLVLLAAGVSLLVESVLPS
jgi:hypothetical protein